MIQVGEIESLRRQIGAWRASGEQIRLVPTMGNLHRGHIRLVEQARQLTGSGRVIVTIFVNPLQFGAGEDFASYPRTLEQDRQLLQAAGADLLFVPSETVMYPKGRQGHTEVTVPGISNKLCGAHRPGHFTGVATVVCKLFNQVRPDVALFGEKDFQQLLVIRRMVADLDLAVEIIGVPTVREESGLALSSRNQYLGAEEKVRAAELYRTLRSVADALGRGDGDYAALEGQAIHRLAQAGFVPDYVSIRRSDDLHLPGADDRSLVILAAARLGKARLIDNLRLERV